MYGTLSVLDTLAAYSGTVANYGEQRAADEIARALAIHNALTNDIIADLCELTDDDIRSYGNTASIEMLDVDEYAAVDAQKISFGDNVGFPLRKRQAAVQWTRDFMRVQAGSELARTFNAARIADTNRIMRDIRKALFKPTNNLTYRDTLGGKNAILPLRALLNADGTAIPTGPSGESFDVTTHTHYLNAAALTAAALNSVIETVVEHGVDGAVTVVISRTDEAAVRALVGFEPYTDPRIIQGSTETYANGALNINAVNDRAIGVFNAAEVHVKSWAIANYFVAVLRAATGKPLALRTRTGTLDGLGALEIDASNEAFPLRAEYMNRVYGVGVWTRTAAGILYVGAGGIYVEPAIA